MTFPDGLGDQAIKDVVRDHPAIGEILEKHEIGCITCSVGICLLKDVVSIHGLSAEEEAAIEQEIGAYLAARHDKEVRPVRDVTAVMVDEHRLILRMIALVEQNAARLEAGGYRDWQFFLDAVEFIRSYADRFHHAKEEDVLFRELVRNGMPAENSPVAAMLLAHNQGRAFVKGMETAALRCQGGAEDAVAEVLANARGYAALLREHIHTEDHVLYPLAERVLPVGWRDGMAAAYADAEQSAPAGLQEHYEAMVGRYEAELQGTGDGR